MTVLHRVHPCRFALAIVVGVALFSTLADVRTSFAQETAPADAFTIRFPAAALNVESIAASNGQALTRVRLDTTEGLGSPTVPGDPDLPVLSRWFAVPEDAEVEGLSIAVEGTSRVGNVGLLTWVLPAQPGNDPSPPVFDLDENEQPVYYEANRDEGPDLNVFSRAGLWPETVAEIASTRKLAGYKLVRVDVRPVQWSPREDSVIFHSSIQVTLVHNGGTTPRPPRQYREARALQDLKKSVVNPERIFIDPSIEFQKIQGLHARYLIITDDYLWSENKQRGASVGGVVAEFERLAEWKRQLGIPSAVVTITDIMDGRYGSFENGTRDLQEVIRNFLKHAVEEFDTTYVLLGGNTPIVPARKVAAHTGYKKFYYGRENLEKPAEYRSYWSESDDTVRIHNVGNVTADAAICVQATGVKFERNLFATANNPGWTFVTNDDYNTPSNSPTGYIIVRGPAHLIREQNFYSVINANSIPTDLYYASLVSSDYGRLGLHDWDHNDNGIYGQYNDAGSIDGVDYYADVMLGRAPIDNDNEADDFVDKTIAYQKHEGLPESFGRTLLLAAANWYGGPKLVQVGNAEPPKGTYYHGPDQEEARLHFHGAPLNGGGQLVRWNGDDSWEVIPYKTEPDGELGFHWCTDHDYDDVSEETHEFPDNTFTLPLRTEWVKVMGPAELLEPESYFFNYQETDLAILQKEQLRQLFENAAPQVDQRVRLYEDLLNAPDYPALDLFELNAGAIEAELDIGYNCVSLTGHGSAAGLARIKIDRVPFLHNGPAGGAVYADGCNSGQIDVSEFTAGAFVKSPNGGSVAYVGNSRYSWVSYGHVLERKFWSGIGIGINVVGAMHNSRWQFAEDNWYHTWANFALNLMGDPSTRLWVGDTRRLSLVHNAVVTKGQDLQVRVHELNVGSVDHAFVVATGPNGQYEKLVTGANGVVNFSTDDYEDNDEILITASKNRFVPVQRRVRVVDSVGSGGFVRADSNGDGEIDLSDAVAVFGYLFIGSDRLPCLDAADANDDGEVDISDGILILGFLFLGQNLPAETTPGRPQTDTSEDDLGCDSLTRLR